MKRDPARFSARVETKDGTPRGKLYLYDAIGGWDGITAKDIVGKLDELRLAGATALDVYVNSPGGDVFDGMAIHAEISRWDRGETVVTVDGLGASIASAIAMAGDRVVLSPHAMLMVHNPRTFAVGDPAQLRKTADNLEAIRGVLIGVYTDATGLERDEIGKLMDAETWMTAEEAIAKGFADEIAGADREDEVPDGEVAVAALADIKVTAVHFDRPIPAQAFAAWNMADKQPLKEQNMSTDNAASLALSTALAELGLQPDATPAQITARVLQLKQPGVPIAEFEALKAQVAERNAQDAVAKAMTEHKLTAVGTPLHSWALETARKAPEFFASWAAATPALIPELKQPAARAAGTTDMSEDEIKGLAAMGMTVEQAKALDARADAISKGAPIAKGGAK